ncbi:RecQ family ATP-dependent DNA helicase [Virgibacillus sp. C22-A2]|uniref:RecQ family ATP-dependent DNA helicase n=1 Tax=Virgibacillus tibetensis TaxID=3042313 RepID=A0ABU6KBG2_9BACI|nr:RecQ family ATP-dependent DNA helicase [Virgibacillus sp. C22-A2]
MQSILETSLTQHFTYNSFRTGQLEIIQDVMNGNDVLGILPTGSGKSICYQLPAKLLDGVTIVVSPLISLMIDQVKQLKAINFKEVVALNSFMTPFERKEVYKNLHTYKLIYVSPELLQKKELQQKLEQLNIRLFVVDEAHCISQWGHEFRPDYLKLNAIIKFLNNPTVMALSATATPTVQLDIVNALDKPNMIKHIYPMDRDNITFNIQKVANDQDKISVMAEKLLIYRTPTLIYFSSRKASEKVSAILSKKLPSKRISFYHGGMEQIDRISIQQQFMNDQLDIICCTSAFGMGINKSNIRMVIHYHLPPQLEAYIQEVGRAGRDGQSSVSILLFSENDIYLPKNIINKELPSAKEINVAFKELYHLYVVQGKLPDNESKIENLMGVNEIQWRFLCYQFEKNGMIIGNTINYNRKSWELAYNEITKLALKRLRAKENKLKEMLEWIHEEGCLRKHLYKGFQPSYSNPKYQCCSNCGFSWREWKPKETEILKYTADSWESKLKNLLLIGVTNEAK